MITHIHHLNFLVSDMGQAIERYQSLLDCDRSDFIYDELKSRSVKTARVLLGQTWLVLVQPLSEDGVAAKHLREHGEGFFLLSLGCDDLDKEIARISSTHNLKFSTPERRGLDDWRIRDLAPEPFNGVQIQITEEEASDGKLSKEQSPEP